MNRPSAACPTHDELAAYAQGKLPDQRWETIDMHLEQCTACLDELDTCSNTDDPFLVRLREPVSADGFLDEPECQALMDRVAAIGRQPPSIDQREPSDLTNDEAEVQSLGPYRLLEQLGAGGMGTVYRALHTKLNRIVAVKLLPTERWRDRRAVERFEQEMQAVGKLHHPNIVNATDADEIDGRHFLVMEHVEGIDLSALVRRHGPLPIDAACELVRQAAVGLQHAHEHGLVHRDLKPSNLMLSWRQASSLSMHEQDARAHQPIVKTLDFGLALLSAETDSALTSTGHAMGTPDYMAPEQWDDCHTVDIRADIYSLGATLYKLLCGEAPFGGASYRNTSKKFQAVTSRKPQPIGNRRPEVSKPLAAVVHKMLAKKPDRRFKTPAEVAAALEPFAAGADLPALLDNAFAARSEQASGHTSIAPSSHPPFAKSIASLFSKWKAVWSRSDRKLLIALSTLVVFGAVLSGIIITIKDRFGNTVARIETDVPRGGSASIKIDKLHQNPFEGDRQPDQDPFQARRETGEELPLPDFGPADLSPTQLEFAKVNSVPPTIRVPIEGEVEIDMVLIPPGEFLYGSPNSEPDRSFNEIDQRRETVATPYYLARTEITRQQWNQILSNTLPAPGDGSPNHPVSAVSYRHAEDFVSLLSEKTGLHFRLPTEIEWEYACRAGTQGEFYCGLSVKLAEHEHFGQPTGAPGVLYKGKPQPVATKKPNPWGLYDMLGNVNEWCSGIPEGSFGGKDRRAVRGGCVLDQPKCMRAAARHLADFDSTITTGVCYTICGLRVALDVEEYKSKVIARVSN